MIVRPPSVCPQGLNVNRPQAEYCMGKSLPYRFICCLVVSGHVSAPPRSLLSHENNAGWAGIDRCALSIVLFSHCAQLWCVAALPPLPHVTATSMICTAKLFYSLSPIRSRFLGSSRLCVHQFCVIVLCDCFVFTPSAASPRPSLV